MPCASGTRCVISESTPTGCTGRKCRKYGGNAYGKVETKLKEQYRFRALEIQGRTIQKGLLPRVDIEYRHSKQEYESSSSRARSLHECCSTEQIEVIYVKYQCTRPTAAEEGVKQITRVIVRHKEFSVKPIKIPWHWTDLVPRTMSYEPNQPGYNFSQMTAKGYS